MINKVKGFVSSKVGKVVTAVSTGSMAFGAFAVSAFAAESSPVVDASINTAISDGLNGIKTAAIVGVASIAGIALGVFAGPFIIRYGKKIFKVASA